MVFYKLILGACFIYFIPFRVMHAFIFFQNYIVPYSGLGLIISDLPNYGQFFFRSILECFFMIGQCFLKKRPVLCEVLEVYFCILSYLQCSLQDSYLQEFIVVDFVRTYPAVVGFKGYQFAFFSLLELHGESGSSLSDDLD